MKKLWVMLLLLSSCGQNRIVNTSFYYWKTVYRDQAPEQRYLEQHRDSGVFVRIMDIDNDESGMPVPVSPIAFQTKLPASVKMVPVVFIVNDILKTAYHYRLNDLANRIAKFVNAKAVQAGKPDYRELQIDCDWTASTRENYFYLLNRLAGAPALRGKYLSVTLRLHQLINLRTCGIPPVKRVLLMCYNMGNLRKYGTQNSIIEVSELKKYVRNDLSSYPLKIDIGLPLFGWAVIFRNKQYRGISRNITIDSLQNKQHFGFGGPLYTAITDLPQFGLLAGDVVRWEDSTPQELEQLSAYLSPKIKADTLTIVYFHLDQILLKKYPRAQLEKITGLWR